MTEDQWEELSSNIPWKFELVTPSGPRAKVHIKVLEPISIGVDPANLRVRKEKEILCETVRYATRSKKAIRLHKVVGYATPTCAVCERVLLQNYSENTRE